jgi:hypothetical protein
MTVKEQPGTPTVETTELWARLKRWNPSGPFGERSAVTSGPSTWRFDHWGISPAVRLRARGALALGELEAISREAVRGKSRHPSTPHRR